MSAIQQNLEDIHRNTTQYNSTLVAVSKVKPISSIREAYDAGQRHFGENKVQELTDKYEELPKDIKWHMIGHLQRNKVKQIVPFVHLIHSVDSPRLLEAIEKEASKIGRPVDCLLQVHIAQESTKYGFDEVELKTLLQSEQFDNLSHVHVIGLMGMATNTDDLEQVKKEFLGLKKLYDQLAADHPKLSLRELSMGMSGDYSLALECGSTMIRVGSKIFGERNYG